MAGPSKLPVPEHEMVRGLTVVMDTLWADIIPSLLHRSRDNPMPNRPRWPQRTAGNEEPPSGKPMGAGESWESVISDG